MHIFLAQQNYTIGDISGNTEKIISGIEAARNQQADLVIFSELSVCGYPVQDFLEFEDFIDRCESAIERIQKYTDDIGVVLGAPYRNPEARGKDLLNSAYLLFKGKIKHIAHKSCLPTYDIFDECRYFEPAFDWKVVEFKGKRLALTICEDIWSLNDDNLYRFCPMDEMMKEQPDIMINISASPFDYDQREKRLDIIKKNVSKYRLPLFYCNTVGTQTGIGFDGGSVIMDAKGNIQKELPYFEEAIEGISLSDFNEGVNQNEKFSEITERADGVASLHPATGNLPMDTRRQIAGLPYNAERNIDRIYQALVMGISDYFDKLHFSRAILGSSGGIDSAVALSLACAALGPENVYAVMLPSPFSSTHSVEDAVQLSKNLGQPYEVIPIEKIYNASIKTLKPQFKTMPFNVAEENLQARIRASLLMAMANKFGYILLNTSNKSELSVGYGTLYGDLAGGLSILGDVYKTQVYALARYINGQGELIPENILSKSPSAELRPGQKDSDSLPDYETLDSVLYEHIEQGRGMRDILASGTYEKETVQRIFKLFYSVEYKRHQFCPILRVSGKAFGEGKRIPIVGKWPG